jgi:iron complex outermembrane receptor protein
MTFNRPASLRLLLLTGASLAAGVTFAPAAFAQTAGDSAAGTGEVVVTAQRKEEKLSRVPVSVVAFGADQLRSKVINSEQDLGTLVPGLVVKNGQTANQLSYSMRGQTLDPFSGTSPAVLTYLNEAPYNPYNSATSLFDLSSVQVLKGPQGTLFGRNATGGAVLYSTPTPGNVFSGNLIARGGQRGTAQIQGAVDLPLVKDKLSIRLAGDYTREDGFIRNINTGNTLGDKDNVSGRVTVLFRPTDKIKNTTVFQYSDFKGTEGAGNLRNYYTFPNESGQQFINTGITSTPNTTGTALTSTLDTVYNVFSGLLFNTAGNNLGDSNLTAGPAIAPGRWPGGVAGYAAWSHAHPYQTWLQFDTPHRGHTTFVSNTTEFAVSDGLKIKNLFSYMDSYSLVSGNLAGGPFGALWLFNNPNNLSGVSGNGGPGGQTFNSRQYSEELQIQGKLLDNKLGYTAGGFYSSLTHFDVIPVFVGSEINPSLGAAAAFGLPADIDYTSHTKDISKAIYAQVDYKVTDKLTAVLGGRYTWESVSLSQAPGSLFTVLGVTTVGALQHKNLSAPAWTFNLQYQIDSSNMVYFSQRGSFRSGNFNGTVNPLNNANYFGNETAHDFELGYKYSGRVGTAPVRFNAAIYEEIVKNAQHAVYAVIGGNPAGFTLNVPEARTKGVEVDTSVGLTRWLTLSATGAYTDGQYTKGKVDVSALTGVPGYSIQFNSYPDSPKWTGSVAADVTLPVSENIGKVILHGEVYSQSNSFFSSNNGSVTPGTELSGYTSVNMRLSWNNIMQSKISAGVYAKNLFNSLYYVSGFAMGAAGGYNTAYPGAPRTVAAELSVKF